MTRTPFLSSSVVLETTVNQAVTHETIAARARELWAEQGCPVNCDEAIWLEAEAELLATQQKRYRHPHLPIAAKISAELGNHYAHAE